MQPVTVHTVHIVDDDRGVRDAVTLLLQTEGYAVRAYESGRALLEDVEPAHSGCIITDVRMPELSGIDLLGSLKARGILMPVIVITGHADVALAVDAMKQGAVDFLEKPFSAEALLAAVGASLRRASEVSSLNVDPRVIRERFATLSHREAEVFERLFRGQPNKVIAFELGVGARTVETHRANVMTKMGAKSLSELVRMALVVPQEARIGRSDGESRPPRR